MFEEIFDVKRGRNLLEMFLSPTDDDGLLKDIERCKSLANHRSKLFFVVEKSILDFFLFFEGLR